MQCIGRIRITSTVTPIKDNRTGRFSYNLAMFQFFCFCAVILTVNSQFSDRIVNGRVVDIQDFPFQVGLVYERGGRKRIICGGALIKPKIVFTAAHCTHQKGGDDERENLSVLVGANYLGDENGRLHEIEKTVKHPDYGFDYDHDFSLILLKEPVQFSNRAQPIAVSTKDDFGGNVAVASGWGLTEYRKPSKYLRATELEVEHWDKCQDYFPHVLHPKITRNMICVKPSSQTTYFGDSGGPLTVNGELVGLVSFGRPITRSKKTTVFTRVKNFLGFAEEEIANYNSNN